LAEDALSSVAAAGEEERDKYNEKEEDEAGDPARGVDVKESVMPVRRIRLSVGGAVPAPKVLFFDNENAPGYWKSAGIALLATLLPNPTGSAAFPSCGGTSDDATSTAFPSVQLISVDPILSRARNASSDPSPCVSELTLPPLVAATLPSSRPNLGTPIPSCSSVLVVDLAPEAVLFNALLDLVPTHLEDLVRGVPPLADTNEVVDVEVDGRDVYAVHEARLVWARCVLLE
ncbi:hypothetical protein KEM55_008629, partial [Ascosphaera atra]